MRPSLATPPGFGSSTRDWGRCAGIAGWIGQRRVDPKHHYLTGGGRIGRHIREAAEGGIGSGVKHDDHVSIRTTREIDDDIRPFGRTHQQGLLEQKYPAPPARNSFSVCRLAAGSQAVSYRHRCRYLVMAWRSLFRFAPLAGSKPCSDPIWYQGISRSFLPCPLTW